MQNIKIAIAGVGNCASSLVQGIHYYRSKSSDEAFRLIEAFVASPDKGFNSMAN